MTHSILLIVPKPDKKNALAHQAWEILPITLSKLSISNKTLEILGQNILLLQIDETLNVLSEVVAELRKLDLDYKYAIFDEEMKISEVVNEV